MDNKAGKTNEMIPNSEEINDGPNEEGTPVMKKAAQKYC
jgi:hypothetical protein